MKETNPKAVRPEIVIFTTYPPRECGIATYTQDLIVALQNKFKKTFRIKICALELSTKKHIYSKEVAYVLQTDNPASYNEVALKIKQNPNIEIVVIQHEFGLFRNFESNLLACITQINKPLLVVFHTVLPKPNEAIKHLVKNINNIAQGIIVMTQTSSEILKSDYGIDKSKIDVIPHGTHLVTHLNKSVLKEKYHLGDRKILATFGLISSGKGIETTINALRLIVKRYPNVLFLIIGKTHPAVVKEEGEQYRETLKAKIIALHLQENVLFMNEYLPLNTLLEYLQLTDIYLFTSKDRNQAVSGTFSYALSCGCPIISTPIPHAIEVLQQETGVIVDFENHKQLARKVIQLLEDEELCATISTNAIHKMAPTAWENTAIAHAFVFEKITKNRLCFKYKMPKINLNHLQRLTTDYGMIQFCNINQPDIGSGYTLDDNARALVAICQHYRSYKNKSDLAYITLYFNFIKNSWIDKGSFLNYLDEGKNFTDQNNETNLSDSNGRAIWALGYLISNTDILPKALILQAKAVLQLALSNVMDIHSPRAMAFIIKGIYYSNQPEEKPSYTDLTKHLADKLVQMYKHESKVKWQWYESYLTYGNSILPEAMLCAYLTLGTKAYKEIACTSFDFLLSEIFSENSIKVISNKGWLHKDADRKKEIIGGEQPIDVAYTILALSKFYDTFKNEDYKQKMEIAFHWFLGKNHLNQIVYNPCTGGCYDGLEEFNINLNQGAESTVSYLMARMTLEENRKKRRLNNLKTQKSSRIKSLKINPQKQIEFIRAYNTQ
jgi:glycosyltransferase involved in cell wall biosynthesis